MDIHKLTEEEAMEIAMWTYEEPYNVYSFSVGAEIIEELLDGTYYGCCDERGELIGYFCFGENAQVPGGRDAHLYGGEDVMDIGLGMKPELTGKGLGKVFFQAGIVFAIKAFRPKTFRLSVATFNTRAITLYKKIGFQQGPIFLSRGREFMLMEYERPSV
ncbi:N-acetyltransferase family protein [Bacillus paranthracis]|uniref:Acetyltransferase, GNAT family n=1 Tax=Bacillus cereus (strain Q1) TaxID=361100 RepID=B9J3F6_BACCQ|nr:MULTISPECIES: GNAT family N-acetyltransferase [Bacillus cereus group]ACM15175.1 acetyltransferase, GNAT family [Bacillus cereus Q1]MBY5228423.1 acetyltransferase [Bacillus paranthracis]MCY9248877.1 GNAT family N-acetyltransferase [Bacillus paranthracis]MDA1499215.1 GNAT family N-acetyltransferase [Bacillus cereus group sp. TH41-1LC]MDA1685284.1 GNAT family N-acetyltransferase [Bacillus cereus group sp. m2-21]